MSQISQTQSTMSQVIQTQSTKTTKLFIQEAPPTGFRTFIKQLPDMALVVITTNGEHVIVRSWLPTGFINVPAILAAMRSRDNKVAHLLKSRFAHHFSKSRPITYFLNKAKRMINTIETEWKRVQQIALCINRFALPVELKRIILSYYRPNRSIDLNPSVMYDTEIRRETMIQSRLSYLYRGMQTRETLMRMQSSPTCVMCLSKSFLDVDLCCSRCNSLTVYHR